MRKILLWLLLVSIAFILLFFCSELILVKSTKPLDKADLIIVLGNPANEDGSIGTTQKNRVDAGIFLLKNGFANKILFTGGAAANQFVEAEVMKNYAIEKGVAAESILTEGQSKNTIENAFFSNKLITYESYNSLIVVTSAYHTLRAQHIFSYYTNNLHLKAVPYAKELGILYRIKAMLHEYAAWLYYSINGWEVT